MICPHKSYLSKSPFPSSPRNWKAHPIQHQGRAHAPSSCRAVEAAGLTFSTWIPSPSCKSKQLWFSFPNKENMLLTFTQELPSGDCKQHACGFVVPPGLCLCSETFQCNEYRTNNSNENRNTAELSQAVIALGNRANRPTIDHKALIPEGTAGNLSKRDTYQKSLFTSNGRGGGEYFPFQWNSLQSALSSPSPASSLIQLPRSYGRRRARVRACRWQKNQGVLSMKRAQKLQTEQRAAGDGSAQLKFL